MKRIVFSTLLLFIFAVGLSVIGFNQNYAAADDSLDGKSFVVKISEHGKDNEPTDDELIFKDGTFFSTDCEQYGFGKAPYESMSKGDFTLFKAVATSKKEGKAEWEGKVTGDKIAGTFMWSKEGQDPIIYTYEGSLNK